MKIKSLKLFITITIFVFGFLLNSKAGSVGNFDMEHTNHVEVTLYPNPVTDGVLKVTAEKEIKKLEILNIVGEKILSQVEPEPSTSVQLNVNNLNSGIYLITVTFTDNTINTKRIWVK